MRAFVYCTRKQVLAVMFVLILLWMGTFANAGTILGSSQKLNSKYVIIDNLDIKHTKLILFRQIVMTISDQVISSNSSSQTGTTVTSQGQTHPFAVNMCPQPSHPDLTRFVSSWCDDNSFGGSYLLFCARPRFIPTEDSFIRGACPTDYICLDEVYGHGHLSNLASCHPRESFGMLKNLEFRKPGTQRIEITPRTLNPPSIMARNMRIILTEHDSYIPVHADSILLTAYGRNKESLGQRSCQDCSLLEFFHFPVRTYQFYLIVSTKIRIPQMDLYTYLSR